STVDLSETLKNMLEEFRELFELKNIHREADIQESVTLEADKVLIELLLTNLINNAIRHNWEKGKIKMTLTDSSLLISNTGPELTIDPKELFNRFKKSNQSSQSLGLGLAIVKKICDFYDYEIKYEFTDDLHTIQLAFLPPK
ncbi:MAG: HAMP domain-containing sensor histidine kinase, partial [Bacteroidota bacterium]